MIFSVSQLDYQEGIIVRVIVGMITSRMSCTYKKIIFKEYLWKKVIKKKRKIKDIKLYLFICSIVCIICLFIYKNYYCFANSTYDEILTNCVYVP